MRWSIKQKIAVIKIPNPYKGFLLNLFPVSRTYQGFFSISKENHIRMYFYTLCNFCIGSCVLTFFICQSFLLKKRKEKKVGFSLRGGHSGPIVKFCAVSLIVRNCSIKWLLWFSVLKCFLSYRKVALITHFGLIYTLACLKKVKACSLSFSF